MKNAAVIVATVAVLTATAPAHGAVWTSRTQAWIYPGAPGCGASREYADGRAIDTLKPQYYHLAPDGTLATDTVALAGCNGYSPANAADVRSHSAHQYITVSGDEPSMAALVSSPALSSKAVASLASAARMTGFTGIEIDFEGFAQWTAADYAGYRALLDSLGSALHAQGNRLMVDGPAIGLANDGEHGQNIYKFRYEDIGNDPDVDSVVVLDYDYQYDYGAGSPVSPDAWSTLNVEWALSKVTDRSKVTVGIPSYGYHSKIGSYAIRIDTYAQSKALPGFRNGKVGDSGELYWQSGGTDYVAQATSSLDHKRALLESLGITSVSVWSLGGNNWF